MSALLTQLRPWGLSPVIRVLKRAWTGSLLFGEVTLSTPPGELTKDWRQKSPPGSRKSSRSQTLRLQLTPFRKNANLITGTSGSLAHRPLPPDSTQPMVSCKGGHSKGVELLGGAFRVADLPGGGAFPPKGAGTKKIGADGARGLNKLDSNHAHISDEFANHVTM